MHVWGEAARPLEHMPLSDLTTEERQVVFECLRAAANGPFFPDREFDTLFGVKRDEVRAIVSAWPAIDETNERSVLAINNAMNNLVGYPHGCNREWLQYISVSSTEVARILQKWRRKRIAWNTGNRIVENHGDRRELVESLVRYDLPIEPVLERLAAFGWDADAPLVQIRVDDVLAILNRYLAGELSADQIEDWANHLEVRDDVGMDPPHEEVLREIIFRLANPYLNHEITPELVNNIHAELVSLKDAGAG